MTAPQPYPARKQARVQRLPAVALRLLVSVSLLAACVPLLRLTLVSAPGVGPVGAQHLTQQEALGAAKSASLRLAGDWTDVHVSSADLQGDLMRGEITLPKDARVQHALTRAASAADSVYSVSAPAPLSLPQPLRFTLNRQGLNVGNAARSGRVGSWNVKIGQKVPAALSITTSSGDQALDLSGAALSSLTVAAQSGEVSVRLPGNYVGSARLSSQSGDLTVEQASTVQEATSAAQGPTTQGMAAQRPASSIEIRSTSGTQLLNLSASSFSQVRASTGSGDVRLRLPDRPGVAAALSTQSGELRVTVLAALNSGDVNAQTSSGDIVLILPVGASVRLAASPFLGDLSVPEGYVQDGGAYLSPAARRGVPALHVSLSTQSGSMTVSEPRP